MTNVVSLNGSPTGYCHFVTDDTRKKHKAAINLDKARFLARFDEPIPVEARNSALLAWLEHFREHREEL